MRKKHGSFGMSVVPLEGALIKMALYILGFVLFSDPQTLICQETTIDGSREE
jgi:hypothetical protein